MEGEDKTKVLKRALLILLILLCAGTTYYFHFIRRSEVVFSHLFYVPVILAGFWWSRRGAWVGVPLGALLLTSHLLSGLGTPLLADVARSVMFVVVGLMVGILREEALRSEENLRETRDYLDSLIRYANAPIIVWDPEFRITRFNHAFEHLTGYTADEVIGQELPMLFPEASRDESLSKIERTLSGEYWESVAIPILRKDGETRLALWNSANIYAEDGTTLLATIAQGQDITERVRAEEALDKRLRELICLYAVHRNMQEDFSSDELCQCATEHLASAMQFPEITTSVIELNGRRFTSGGYIEGLSHGLHAEIRVDGETQGHLWVYYTEDRPFLIPEEQNLLDAIAGDIGVWLEHKQAEEELRQSYVKLQRALEGTVHTLVSAIEMRDPYTAGHQQRVTQLACTVANEMGLPQKQIEGLRMAGLVHDIGKIDIPAEILSHPGPLNDLQYGLIRAHSQVGYDILKETDFPWPVAQIVLQHHERLDGSGYPQRLSGEEIILEARILAVADVVEAMASFRPYRPSRGLNKALEEISQNRGVLYDPEVVDVCLALFTEKGFTFE